MISIVTSSTVYILTSSASVGSLALIPILVLLTLLLQKEVASTSADSRIKQLSRVLNIGIVPLLLAFIMIVVYKVVEVLN